MSNVATRTAVRAGADSGAGVPATLLARAVRVCLALVAAIAFTAVAAPIALAATGLERVGSFNDASPEGRPAHQHRIAVNHLSGDVYVTDPATDRVKVSRPTGTSAVPLTAFGSGDVTDPFGIAIDQATGDVYVSDSTHVIKYASDGAPMPTFTKDNAFTSPAVTGPLAFDQANDQLLVADTTANLVRRYDPDGTPDGSFDGSAGTGAPGAFTGLQDLAVDSAGDIVIIDATGNPTQNGSVSRVERYASNGDWKATIGPVEQAATVAIRPATNDVIVSGNQNVAYTNGTPSVHVFASDGTERTQVAVDGALTYATVSGIAADDGAEGQVYVASDNGDFFGAYTFGYISVQVYAAFTIQLPEVTVSDTDTQILQRAATLVGTVDTKRDNTAYRYEYGTDTSYGQSAPAGPPVIGAGAGPTAANASISGLQPATTYHYRLTATNSAGTTIGEDHTLTTAPALAPEVTVADAQASQTVVALSGAVDTKKDDTTWSFEYGLDTSYGESAPASPEHLGPGTEPTPVSTSLVDLQPDTTYHYRLTATNAAGATNGDDHTFTTAAALAPEVSVEEASTTQYGASVRAVINPKLADTTWTFEYGSDTSYGTQLPATPATIAAGSDRVPVASTLEHMDPGTTLHYRLTATNASGTTVSPDHTFTTRAATVGGGRDSSRGFELVSPPDKEGNGILPFSVVQSSPDGTGVAFAAHGAFVDAVQNMQHSYYLSRRSASGWETHALDAPQQNSALAGNSTRYLSSDLKYAAQVSQKALTPGASEGGTNTYRRDNTTGQRSLIYGMPEYDEAVLQAGNSSGSLIANRDDLSHSIFPQRVQLDPDAPTGVQNTYESVNGQVRLASRLPNGDPVPGGAVPGAISRDGSRILFLAQPDSGLYMRINGTSTIAISASHRAGDPSDVALGATLTGMSGDGSVVYFTSGSPLTEVNQGGLYRLDVDTNQLRLLTPLRPDEPNSLDVQGWAVADNGQTAVILTRNNLDGWHPTGDPYSLEFYNVYVLRDGGVHWVASTASSDQDVQGNITVSPNGRYVAISSTYGNVIGYNNVADCNTSDTWGLHLHYCMQTYVWDADTDLVSCTTCSPGHAAPQAAFDRRAYQYQGKVSGYVPRNVLNDGQAFVTTRAALVSQDTNGKFDVYRWKGGVATLITSGTDSHDAMLADVSADGSDVFFLTAGRLVGIDKDSDVDVYDARVGGGLASQNPSPQADTTCTGDTCQGQPANHASTAPAIGSVTFSGPMDPPEGTDEPQAPGRATVSARKSVKGSKFSVSVKTPAAGTVKVAGSGLITTSKKVSKASTTKITVKLTKRARSTLKKKALKVKARVSFTQAGQPASTTIVSVTLKA
jgi:hypothetical protein